MGNSRKQRRRRGSWLLWLWVSPSLLLIAVFLVYPMLNTIWLSLLDANSDKFVGLTNYGRIFTNPIMLGVLRNNLLWLVVATALTVGLGLIIAFLVDRLPVEALVKSTLFVPMAISFVGAGVIWRFVYLYTPANRPQVGLLNAILVSLGMQPQVWLINPAINNFALILVYVWMWTGFCVVVLSAALKGIPDEIIEAARMDGASNLMLFWNIAVPMIWPTVVVVTTTMIINILKIFDIVYVMTGGVYNTDVVAVQYYEQLYINYDYGVGSALAVLLLIAIVPVMYMNIRRIRIEEARR